jgi:hypothetical protein
MLVQIDGNGDLKDITALPHKADFDRWRAGLTDTEYDAIRDEIDRRVGDQEVNVSSFLPGADWSGTPFWPIYASAGNRDFDAARKFFGLLVWEYMMNRDDAWSFGRYDIRGVAVEGLVYFRVNR